MRLRQVERRHRIRWTTRAVPAIGQKGCSQRILLSQFFLATDLLDHVLGCPTLRGGPVQVAVTERCAEPVPFPLVVSRAR